MPISPKSRTVTRLENRIDSRYERLQNIIEHVRYAHGAENASREIPNLMLAGSRCDSPHGCHSFYRSRSSLGNRRPTGSTASRHARRLQERLCRFRRAVDPAIDQNAPGIPAARLLEVPGEFGTLSRKLRPSRGFRGILFGPEVPLGVRERTKTGILLAGRYFIAKATEEFWPLVKNVRTQTGCSPITLLATCRNRHLSAHPQQIAKMGAFLCWSPLLNGVAGNWPAH
jgi:hypothetical protein